MAPGALWCANCRNYQWCFKIYPKELNVIKKGSGKSNTDRFHLEVPVHPMSCTGLTKWAEDTRIVIPDIASRRNALLSSVNNVQWQRSRNVCLHYHQFQYHETELVVSYATEIHGLSRLDFQGWLPLILSKWNHYSFGVCCNNIRITQLCPSYF